MGLDMYIYILIGVVIPIYSIILEILSFVHTVIQSFSMRILGNIVGHQKEIGYLIKNIPSTMFSDLLSIFS